MPGRRLKGGPKITKKLAKAAAKGAASQVKKGKALGTGGARRTGEKLRKRFQKARDIG